jgi:hypothetical protein
VGFESAMNDVYSMKKDVGSAFLTLFLFIFLYFDYLNEILRVLNYQGLPSCTAFQAQKTPLWITAGFFKLMLSIELSPTLSGAFGKVVSWRFAAVTTQHKSKTTKAEECR